MMLEYSSSYSASAETKCLKGKTKCGRSFCAGTSRISDMNEKMFLYSTFLKLLYILSSKLQGNVIFLYLNKYYPIDFSIYLTCI